MSVAREPAEFHSIMVRKDRVVTDSDSDGVVTFSLDAPAAVKSVFIAVDLTSAEMATAQPENSPFEAVGLAGSTESVAPGLSSLHEPRTMIEALLVRPGVGAWRVTAGDGAQGDLDGVRDNIITAPLADLETLEGTQSAPATLSTGDVLVVVDPKRMQYYAGKVAP